MKSYQSRLISFFRNLAKTENLRCYVYYQDGHKLVVISYKEKPKLPLSWMDIATSNMIIRIKKRGIVKIVKYRYSYDDLIDLIKSKVPGIRNIQT